MVEKISVNIKVVSLNVEHNFLIPSEMNVGDAIALVLQTLFEEYSGIVKLPPEKASLMQASTGKLLNKACSLDQLGIIQGENLLLI